MTCRMADLRNKEVINLTDGARVGYVCDVEIDTAQARLSAVVIYGRPRLLGLLGREPDLVIPWREISLIGAETVLVSLQRPPAEEKGGALGKFLAKIGL